MATALLTLKEIPRNVETCLPNLMPFRISYSGPAAISTFMNVKPAGRTEETDEVKPVTDAQEPSSSSSLLAETASTPGVNASPIAVDTDVAMSTVDSKDTTEKKEAPSESTEALIKIESEPSDRFVSTFRGRTIQGLTVNLPEGYGGLILRSSGSQSTSKGSDAPTAKAPKKQVTSRAKPRGRLTRSAAGSKRIIDVDEPIVETIDDNGEDLDAMDLDAPLSAVSEKPVLTRNLVPTAQFSSFVVWRPDNPVVEIQDEYIRSLQEWTALASEVHRSEGLA